VCTINKFPLTSFLETLILTVCTINKLSLTSFLESFLEKLILTVCTINKFPLTSFLEKLILTVCTINKFPLTCFVARVRGILSNIYLTSRPLLVRQNRRSISCTLVNFSLAAVHTNIFFLSESWLD
jgi:hypothetical protein